MNFSKKVIRLVMLENNSFSFGGYLEIQAFSSLSWSQVFSRLIVSSRLYGGIYLKWFQCLHFLQCFYTLILFWPILGQRKTSLVVFLYKRRTSSVVFFFANFISNGLTYSRLLEIVLGKKTTELVLLFHKKTTKLVFL